MKKYDLILRHDEQGFSWVIIEIKTEKFATCDTKEKAEMVLLALNRTVEGEQSYLKTLDDHFDKTLGKVGV